MKRLAILWLVCAAAGFVVAVGVVVVLSFTIDGGPRPTSTHAPEQRSAPAN